MPRRTKPNTDLRDCLTPNAIARYLGISPRKVLAFIRTGELKAVNLATLGKSPRFHIEPDALAAFLDAREVLRAT